MTAVPRVLTIQDMSSIGRCALTVMIPIISAMRCQAVPLATAVLSNHLEYPHYEFVDLKRLCILKNNKNYKIGDI